MRRLLALAGLVALLLALPSSAAAKGCGDGVGGPDYHDLTVRGMGCDAGQRVVYGWLDGLRNVFRPVQVDGLRCVGVRSSRRIGDVRAFRITCKGDGDRVRWWIRPTD